MRIKQGLLYVFLFCVAMFVDAAQPTKSQQPREPVRGTEAEPIVIKEILPKDPPVIKVLPIEKTPFQIAQDEKDRSDRARSDLEAKSYNQILIAVGLLQAFIFGLQWLAFRKQSASLNQTVAAAAEQSRDMKRYIDEASRSANAMEGMANAMKANVAAVTDAFALQKVAFQNQLRAYIAVSFKGCILQDKRKKLKFEIHSDITNTGNTPAVNPCTNSFIRVFPHPLPADVDLNVAVTELDAAANLAPHRSFFISTVCADYLSDEELAEVKEGVTKRLYVFGRTNYKDVVGAQHYTNFCWSIQWNHGGAPVATNAPRHNDAS